LGAWLCLRREEILVDAKVQGQNDLEFVVDLLLARLFTSSFVQGSEVDHLCGVVLEKGGSFGLFFMSFNHLEALIQIVQKLEGLQLKCAANVPVLVVFLNAIDIEVVKRTP
jgi:hypothetical protein